MSDDIDAAAMAHAWGSVVRPLVSYNGDAGIAGDDLQVVADLVGDARVVGLGESTHGSSELFTLKHRVIELLVTQLGFTAVAFEASYAGSLMIDRFVRQGSGDLSAALTAQGYLAWDCAEVMELLAMLRRYNTTAEPTATVAFWGLDSGYNAVGRTALTPLLDSVDVGVQMHALRAFARLDELEPRWPFQLDEPKFDDQLSEVHNVLNELDKALDGAGRYDADVRRLLAMMRRWSGPERHARSRQMGETLVELIDRAPGECRAVVWAHNGHIGRGWDTAGPNLGDVLSTRFGASYVPLALEFGGGSMQARRLDPDLAMGELVAMQVEPAPAGSLPWCLSATGHSPLAVDFREARSNPELKHWLEELPTEHGLGWVLADSDHYFEPWPHSETYDGVLFTRDSTPTRPTPNALEATAMRERF